MKAVASPTVFSCKGATQLDTTEKEQLVLPVADDPCMMFVPPYKHFCYLHAATRERYVGLVRSARAASAVMVANDGSVLANTSLDNRLRVVHEAVRPLDTTAPAGSVVAADASMSEAEVLPRGT